ncbi:MAG: CsbD family protein [Piscinibacter sp.]|uniref:CsbD family protein n=1 Tax=Piscinibacter sp. TaxID=1903157 RepID=UPI003D0CF2AE
MNWVRVERNRKQWKGKAIERWGQLTDEDFDVVAGRRSVLSAMSDTRWACPPISRPGSVDDSLITVT